MTNIKSVLRTIFVVAFTVFLSLDCAAQCDADTAFAISVPVLVNDTCKGDANGAVTIRINPQSSTSTNYSMFFPGNPPVIPTPSATVPGTFEASFNGLSANVYQVIVIDNNGCIDTVDVNIQEPAEPFTILIDSLRNALCGNNGYLAATTIGGWSSPSAFTWTAFDNMMNILPGYPRTLGYQLAGLSEGSYIVEATDFRGCKATASATLAGAAPFEVNIFPPGDQSVDLGDSIDVFASVSSGTNITYQWFPQTYIEPLSADGDSIRITPCSEQSYIVLAIDAARGCSSADSINIRLTGEFEPFVPNIFNTNSFDPRNNVFQAFGIGVIDVDIQIFDRKGGLVYETPTSDTNTLDSWNGRLGGDGALAVAGKYLYIVRIKSICGETVSRQGGVSLLR